MDSLSQGVSPTRLIFMATQLQAVSAALPMSANRRTDAELCLMRLCDESLCGDTAALAARLARLEDGLSGGQPGPVRQSDPARQTGAARQSKPTRQEAPAAPRQSRPQPAGPPPWDDPAPIPDGPPPHGGASAAGGTGTRRPLPAMTTRRLRRRRKSGPPPAPLRRRRQRPRAPASGGLWQALVERYKNQLTPMYRIMLDDAWGDMEGDALVVRCGDELTQETLDCPAVAEVLRSVTGAHLGREVAVRFTLGKGEAPPRRPGPGQAGRPDPGRSKYDSFTVK